MRKSIYTFTILFSLFFLNLSAIAQTSNNTNVNFKIKNIGVYVKGTFNEVSVTSNFNENDLSNSFVNAVIAINSIDTKNKKRDKHLLESDYFDVDNYKLMKLVSNKIEKISSNKYKLTGRLTIKKKTKTVVIPLSISDNGEELSIAANFELNRRDYGVGGSSWVMSNTVKVSVKHTVKK